MRRDRFGNYIDDNRDWPGQYGQYSRYNRQNSDDEPAIGTLVSEDGNVLGGLAHLPTPLRVVYETFEPEIKAWLSKSFSKHATTYTAMGLEALHVSKAGKIAEVTGKTIAYGLPYIDSLGYLNQARQFHHEQRQAILAEVAPLIAAKKAVQKKGALDNITGLFKNGYEHNLMVARALEEVNKATYHKLGSHAADLIPNVVVNLRTNVNARLDEALLNEDHANIEKYTKRSEALDGWVLRGVGAARSGVKELATGKDISESISHLSFGKVLEIGEYLRTNELDRAKGQPSEHHVDEVARMVEATFQQFQKENAKKGYRTIPSHRLKLVSKDIADKLVGGDMNWRSLFDIIGKGELLTKDKSGFKGKKEVEKILENEMSVFNKNSTVNVEQFFSEANYTLDDLKAHLNSKDKDEKALAVFLHSDEILLKAGMKIDDIQEQHAHLSKNVMEKMLGSIVDGLAQLSDEELQSKGYSSEDVYTLRNYSENHRLIDRALGKSEHGKSHAEELKNVVRTGIMGEQSDYLKKILSGQNVATKVEGETGGTKMRDVSEKELEEMPAFKAREEARREARADRDESGEEIYRG